jgi:hypothetical protein
MSPTCFFLSGGKSKLTGELAESVVASISLSSLARIAEHSPSARHLRHHMFGRQFLSQADSRLIFVGHQCNLRRCVMCRLQQQIRGWQCQLKQPLRGALVAEHGDQARQIVAKYSNLAAVKTHYRQLNSNISIMFTNVKHVETNL